MKTRQQLAPESGIKALVIKGRKRGFVTISELLDPIPPKVVDPEQIEDIKDLLKGMGIDVLES